MKIRPIVKQWKLDHPDASIADLIAYLIKEKQNSAIGKQIALGFEDALKELGRGANGDYRFE